MAIDLNKQLGPFPLKIWLIIGAGGIGIGLIAAKHLGSSQALAGGETGTGSQPPPVIFTRVIIGLEHVPGYDEVKGAIKPDAKNPIMASNPASGVMPTVPKLPLSDIGALPPTVILPNTQMGLKPIVKGSNPVVPGFGPNSMNGTYL